MSTITSYYQYELQKLLEAAIQSQMETLAAGHFQDFAAYQKAVGNIMGLRVAVELMDEADKIMREQR
jgi:hypothetical protein